MPAKPTPSARTLAIFERVVKLLDIDRSQIRYVVSAVKTGACLLIKPASKPDPVLLLEPNVWFLFANLTNDGEIIGDRLGYPGVLRKPLLGDDILRATSLEDLGEAGAELLNGWFYFQSRI